jgi:hypothetical protein
MDTPVPRPAANHVRIIGGAWRRWVIRFPPAEGLRPTPDRVRETLFNWLGQTLAGKRCLDLYAGSGALTLEAASRGAALAVAVDRSRVLVDALRATAAALGASAPTKRLELDVRLPWCGTINRSACSRAPCSRSSRASTCRPMSPGSSATRPPVSTRSTQELSLCMYGNSGGGCRTSKSTPSQRQA